jgi:hypothetical protein
MAVRQRGKERGEKKIAGLGEALARVWAATAIPTSAQGTNPGTPPEGSSAFRTKPSASPAR